MSKPTNIFTQHPNEVGLTYFQHFIFAWSIVYKMIKGALACSIHAFFPFLFIETASNIIKGLHEKVEDRKNFLNL